MERETESHLRRFPNYGVPPHVIVIVFLALSLLLAISIVLYLLQPPSAFPTHEVIEIEPGTSLRDSLFILEEKNVVHSSLLLQIVLFTQYPQENVKAGTYVFPEPLTLSQVARAVALGTHNAPPIVLTIHEGLRVEQIDSLAAERFNSITEGEISALAQEKEGYLFPDTYFVPLDYSAQEFVDLLESTFNTKVLGGIGSKIGKSSYTLEEIITMASLLQREANSKESMQTVAGILWKRLEAGMPLQVDAAFEYILGKSSAELTLDDLEIDSPYNTYRNQGLPPTPIANPGLEAIEAALEPISTPYWFYLTGNDGTFRYARTFEEHKRNRALYLD